MHSGLLVAILALLSAVLGGCLQAETTEMGEMHGTPTPSPEPSIPAGAGSEVVISITGEAPANVTSPLWEGGTYREGDRILVGETTILSPGNHILVEVVPVSFGPTRKGVSDITSGISGIVEVRPGENGAWNTWAFVIDTHGWNPDEYFVQVQGIEVPGYTRATRFTLQVSHSGP